MTEPATDPQRSRPRLTLGLLSLSHAAIHAQSALMPLIYPIVIVQFALNPRDIGTFIAITTAIGGSMQLFYGFLTRWVARPVLLGGGQLVFGSALLVSGLTRSIGQLLAAVSAARIGSSPQHPVGNALLSDLYPPERRGFAISVHISVGNVGTVLVPFVGLALIGAVGWQATLALFGIPALVMGTLILWKVREDAAAYRLAAREGGTVRGQLGAVLARGDLRLILATTLITAGGRGLDIIAPFMLLYLRGPLHMSAGTTAALYALLLVGAVVGPLAAGLLSDRFGRRRTLMVYYVLSSLGVLAFLGAGSNLVLLVPLLLPFGTAVFSESPVLQAFLADRATGPIRDVAFSVYFTVSFGIGALWAFVMGTMAAAWGYPAAFVVMAVSYLAAAVPVALVRSPRAGVT